MRLLYSLTEKAKQRYYSKIKLISNQDPYIFTCSCKNRQLCLETVENPTKASTSYNINVNFNCLFQDETIIIVTLFYGQNEAHMSNALKHSYEKDN